MKHTLLTICLITFAFPSWGQTLNIDDLVERNDIYFKKFTIVPFTGEIFGIESGKFKEGKKVGKWVYFYSSGHPKEIIFYKDGIRDGLYES